MLSGCYMDSKGVIRTGPVVPRAAYDKLRVATLAAYVRLALDWEHGDDEQHHDCLVCDLREVLRDAKEMYRS